MRGEGEGGGRREEGGRGERRRAVGEEKREGERILKW